MLSIDSVISHLQKFKAKHGNIEICKVGHFGEINEMSEWDIVTRKVHVKGKTRRKTVVDIHLPDIGPEPD